MSAPLVVRAFRYGAAGTEAFDQVRAELSLYRGRSPEPVAPGLDCLLAMRNERPVARSSWCVTPELHGVEGETGLIGHFEAHDAGSAQVVVAEACAVLAAHGVRRVLGPMNGSTWGRYRLALPGEGAVASESPSFLGEPVNPVEYPEWFEAAAFEVVARYESRVDESPHEPAADARELAERVARAGIRVRTLDPTCFSAESRVLHELSLAAFADNLYYTPIAWEEFRAQD